jgi:Spy/CpxP family protein refolding chaperone
MKKNNVLVGIMLLFVSVCMAQEKEDNRPPQPPKPPTIEQRLNRVSTELNKQLQLTPEQKEKILAAYKTFFTDMDKNRDKNAPPPPPPPPPVKKEIAEKLSGERDAKIKQALTPEQYNKYVEIEKTLRPKHPHEEQPPHEKE